MNTRSQQIPVPQQSARAEVNGMKMYYEIYGTGHPLVLIHGGGSTINTSFGKLIPFLMENHRVIAVEMQAHGRTKDRGRPESFDQDAADIAELLKQLQVQKADVLGFSNGGQTAMVLGMKHAGCIRKLIITSAFYKRKGVPAGFWEGMKKGTFSDMPQIYKDEYLKLNPGDERGLMTMFERDLHRMQNFTDWSDDDLRSIAVPALIVIGDHDLPTHEHALAMQKLIAGSRLAILPGTHGSFMGEAMPPDPSSKMPQAFATLVNEFLAAPVP